MDTDYDTAEAAAILREADERAAARREHEERVAWFAAHPDNQHPMVWH